MRRCSADIDVSFFRVRLLAVEDGHSADCSGALAIQTLFDRSGDLLAFVACGEDLHFDQLARRQSIVDCGHDAVRQARLPDLDRRPIAVGQATKTGSL